MEDFHSCRTKDLDQIIEVNNSDGQARIDAFSNDFLKRELVEKQQEQFPV
jgi:hypothetical protein